MSSRYPVLLTALALLAVAAAAPADAVAAPLFAEVPDAFGTQPCGPGPTSGCYSNYVVLADLDADGDLDAVFASGGGYYVPGSAELMAVYLNDGGQLEEASAAATGGFTGRLRQVAVGDIDGDGDLDLVAPDAWAMQPDAVFVNDGARPPVFADQGAARLGTSSRAGATRLGDLDNDGDLDLVITDWGTAPPGSMGTAHIYLNDGSGAFTEAAGSPLADASGEGTGPIDADLLDADGDFDLDLILASREGESLLFLNDGAAGFVAGHARLPDQPGPYVYGPDACDVDGDGDLDVWLDNGAAQLREQLVINDGDGTFTDETAARVTLNPGADDNEVQCADVDGDGDLDAIVASLSDEERVLLNDGTGTFAGVTDAFPALGDPTLGLDLGDVNGDGRLDAITAQGEAPPFLNRLYLGLPAQPADTRAPTFRAVESDHEVAAFRVPIRFAVVDSATTDVGPRLAEAYVEVTDGAVKVPATWVGGDLYRAVVTVTQAGEHAFRACAKDAAGNAACSGELSFRVTTPGDADAGVGAPDAGGGGGGGDDDGGGCGCSAGGRGGNRGLGVLGKIMSIAGLALALTLGVRAVRRRAATKRRLSS